MEFIKLLLESLEQSVFFLPFALGIYLSYAILKTTDMTTEGSFILGAGVFARLLNSGISFPIAALTSILCGGIAGIGVSAIQAKNRINPLIAGIIALFMLYSLNFQVMGRPNIGVTNPNSFSKISLISIVMIITVVFYLMLASRFGLLLRAFGVNKDLLKTLGKNPEIYRFMGLSMSTALTALSGVIMAVVNGYADLNMGFGMTLTGIGTVVIGQQILVRLCPNINFHAALEIIFCFLGVYLYFLLINIFLSIGIEPIYLKLLLGLILIILLRKKLS